MDAFEQVVSGWTNQQFTAALGKLMWNKPMLV
jgi:hypothetical protein